MVAGRNFGDGRRPIGRVGGYRLRQFLKPNGASGDKFTIVQFFFDDNVQQGQVEG